MQEPVLLNYTDIFQKELKLVTFHQRCLFALKGTSKH